MQSIQNLSLAALRFGHELPGASINARQAGRTDGLGELAASIKAEGVLNSLHAFQDKDAAEAGLYYIDDGNRRLAALQLLVKSKDIAKDALIPVIVYKGENHLDALRKSLAAASTSVPVHPVDQFETFALLLEKGDTPEKIAAHYALPVKVVKQRLALGQLSPVIRKAWRDGKIDAEAAQAYTASPHHGAQEKLWKRNNWESKNAHQIRHALVGSDQENKKLLKFVGEDAYKAAGGKLIEDLFAEKDTAKIADFGLLDRLAGEKLKAEAAKYVEKGWGWAAPASELPNEAQHMWPRKSSPTAEEKAKLGVILSLGYEGGLDVKTGVIKPGVKGIKPSDGGPLAKAPKKKVEGALSNSLAQRLSEQLTYGAGHAMAGGSGELALAFALAALASTDGPICLEERGLMTIREEKGGFDQALPGMLKLSLKDKLATLARIVGAAFDFQILSAERSPFDAAGAQAVLKQMDGKVLAVSLRGCFDRDNYFESVSGSRRIEAIKEMAPDQESAVAKMKKAGQIAACVSAFNKSPTWLPPELRTVHYAGPALKAVKKKTAKKKR